MTRFAVESALDDNTGLECWLIVDTHHNRVVDRAFDHQDALEFASYYQDMADEADTEYEDDGQPDEYTEWQDFDPDC